ncbi:MAG: hypothetical protein IBJ11_07710 [Phycisphaerales bacterium]|nr:hypothetical protein [Phycisphaerales bacterium]
MINLSLASRSGALRAEGGGGAPWGLGAFDAMKEGAMVAVMERRPSGEAEPLPLAWLLGNAGRALPKLRDALMGDRVALRVARSGEGAMEASLAIEVRDTEAAAVEGDRMLAAALSPTPEEARANPLGTMRPDFGGIEPRAVRTVDVASVLGPLAIARVGGLEPVLAWNYRRRHDGRAAAGAAGPGGAQSGPHSGWWTIGIGPSSVRRMSGQLVDGPAGGDEIRVPWLSVGVVRPARLLAQWSERGLPLPAAVARWRAVEEADWRVLGRPEGFVLGAGRITLAPADPK